MSGGVRHHLWPLITPPPPPPPPSQRIFTMFPVASNGDEPLHILLLTLIQRHCSTRLIPGNQVDAIGGSWGTTPRHHTWLSLLGMPYYQSQPSCTNTIPIIYCLLLHDNIFHGVF